MKLQDLTLQQLKEIVEGAPEGATHWNSNEKDDCWKYIKYDGADNYSLDDEGNWETSMEFHSHAKHGFLKLSDIRDRIAELEPVFKVGDLVVLNTGRKIYRVDHIYRTVVWLDSGKESCDVVDIRDVLRHATPEEEAAGHRIDEPASSCGMTAAEIDQFGEDLRNKPYVDFPQFEHKPDTITAQLDPAKYRVVDPALAYDSPSDCPKDDFDAMSEKHRSPSCKCHELPIDAELEVPMVASQHPHYFKDVSGLTHIDVYQVLRLYEVTDPCLQHIVKKALCAGKRGSKDFVKDVQEIADTANRLVEIEGEQGE